MPQPSPQKSRPVMVCNIAQASANWTEGAKAYLVTPSGGSKHRLLVRSRSGRWIDVWCKKSNIQDMREATLWEGDPRYNDPRIPTTERATI